MIKLFLGVVCAIVAAYYLINYLKKTEENKNKTKEEIEIKNIETSKRYDIIENIVQQTDNSQDNDKYAELEKLAKLKKSGIISEEEFNEQKKKILS